MRIHRLMTKIVAWALIAAMVNPLALLPAYGRDTDIFLGSTVSSSTTTAEPNVLIVLDTSDSMNLPEPWREYPGAYDSHVEYLWNDTSIMYAPGMQPYASETMSGISTAEPSANPFSPYGFWGGATPGERLALLTAAVNSANTIDPDVAAAGLGRGLRGYWRNYNDASWYYWLPAGTLETDVRMASPLFNRFRGHQAVAGGQRGGISFTGTPDYSGDNACSGSISALVPSTVFRPSAAPVNAGKYLGDQWYRWEPWLNLTGVNADVYPGTLTVYNGYSKGYLDLSMDPPATWNPIPVDRPARDANGIGYPIRIQGGASAAGWTDPKADLGGAEFGSAVSGFVGSQLAGIRNIYGYARLNIGVDLDPIGTMAERYSAWHGNRDAAPAFGTMTGMPAYYDVTSACDPVRGPESATCIRVTKGQVPAVTVTKTRSCSYVQRWTETDATDVVRYTDGSCHDDGISCNDPTGSNCSGLADPAPCGPTNKENTFYNRDYRSCAWSGRSAIGVGACQWVGRQSINVEGAGWFFYGGSCQESGSTDYCLAGGRTVSLQGTPTDHVTGPHPNPGTDPSYTTTDGCTNNPGLPAGTYYYGGICQGNNKFVGTTRDAGVTVNGPSAANCSNTSWNQDPVATIHGTPVPNLVRDDPNWGCSDLPDENQTCSTRYGGQCDHPYTPYACSSPQTTASVGGDPGTNQFYLVANFNDQVPNLVHDCKRDEPAGNGGSYMIKKDQTFGTLYNTDISNGASSNTASYSNASGQAVASDDNKKIDVYSVNYLNWKFGPKGPNGASIGRKSRLQIAKDALSNLVQTTDGVRFGLMVFNRNSVGNTSEGANVAKRIQRMGNNPADPDYSNRASLVNAINAVVATAQTPLTESLYEAYRYFSGRTPKWGTSNTVAMIGGTISDGYDTSAVCSVGNGTDCPVAGVYRSPMLSDPSTATPAGCQKNFVVLITDGGPQDDFSANDELKAMKYDAGAGVIVSPKTSVDTNQIATGSDQFEQAGTPFGPADTQGAAFDNGYVWLDELAYFMSRADVSPGARNNLDGDAGSTDRIGGRQSITTYAIGFAGANSPVLSSTASNSGGIRYDAKDAAALAAALTAAIIAIKNWNANLAPLAVPIDALNRGQSQNAAYLAFFQPDPTQSWVGTVKKYQLAIGAAACGADNPDAPCLTGQTVLPSGNKNITTAEVDATGRTTIIDPAAVSYWIPSTQQDGGIPNKGGTGYQLLNTPGYDPSNRKVYAHLGDSTVLTDAGNAFKAANDAITKIMLGNADMSNGTREQLINFLRGGDPSNSACNDGDTGTACTSWRVWPHADVQHSQPAVVTYDATQSPPDEYLYYLSNDGLLHAVDTYSGQEKWAFVVDEAYARISSMLADLNGAQIDVADGSPVIYIEDTNRNGVIDAGEKAWLYFGLRRGGRAYYAIDISKKDEPHFKWKLSNISICNPACGASADFAELGQSWSTPVVGRIRTLGATAPALIFGGGYDTNEDNAPVAAADSMGRALFVVNGDTGTLVKKFYDSNVTGGMRFSIPSDVAALNTDGDAQNLIDRIYVGDTGGNIYRFDIDKADPVQWTGKKLAALSDASNRRKILFPPVVVRYGPPDTAESYDAVYVGTGDREHPLLTSTTSPQAPEDKIVMIMDRAGFTMNGDEAYQYPVDFYLTADATITGPTSAELRTKKGWGRGLDDGEKVVSSPSVLFYTLRFGTYAPNGQVNACVTPGQGRVNALDALGGTIRDLSGDGRLTATDRWYAETGRGYAAVGAPIVIGGGGGGAPGVPPSPPPPKKWCLPVSTGSGMSCIPLGTFGSVTKTFWYMESEQ